MHLRVRNGGQEREDDLEPVIKKKTLQRVVENKDKQYKEMRSHYEEKLHYKINEVAMHVHNEKHLTRVIKEKDRLIYVASGLSFFVGGALGWLIH